jgi:hypothetical protein
VRRAVLALLLGSWIAADASAAIRVEMPWRRRATSGGDSTIAINGCGTNAFADGGESGLTNTATLGLGFFGGASDAEIDGGESIVLAVTSAAGGSGHGFEYEVSQASNRDGDGVAGEHFVEAFDGDDLSLGVVAVSGEGLVDVAALFGHSVISSITLTASTDGFTIESSSVLADPGDQFVATFQGLANATSASVAYCGFTMRAPAAGSVRMTNGEGIGVSSGAQIGWIDLDEELEFEFPEPVLGIEYDTNVQNTDGDGVSGEHFVEAFDARDQSLGIRSASGTARIELSAPGFFGDAPIGRVVLIGSEPIQVRSLTWVPEPTAGASGAVALLALAARRLHKS